MKLPILLTLLAFNLPAMAAEKKTSPAPGAEPAVTADSLASYQTADELWKHLEKLREEPTVQPKSREEFLSIVKSWFGGQKAAADEFLKRYPEDPRRYGAQVVSIQTVRQLASLPGAAPEAKTDLTAQRQQLEAIIAAPAAPEEVKGEAAFVRALMFADQIDLEKPESAAAFLQASDEFLAKYGGHSLAPRIRQVQLQLVSKLETAEAEAVLKKYAEGSDERLAAGAKQVLAKRQTTKELKTKPVPLKFTATDGKEVDLEKLRGKVVLVDFWASWCGPCINEMPNVVATYQKLHDKGFEVIGISLDQDKEAMEGSIKKLGMPWPQYFDGKGWQNAISTTFGISAIPAAWLIDKKGMLRETSLRGDALGTEVEKLLAE